MYKLLNKIVCILINCMYTSLPCANSYIIMFVYLMKVLIFAARHYLIKILSYQGNPVASMKNEKHRGASCRVSYSDASTQRYLLLKQLSCLQEHTLSKQHAKRSVVGSGDAHACSMNTDSRQLHLRIDLSKYLVMSICPYYNGFFMISFHKSQHPFSS